jgi:hypothetical protein
LGLLLTALAPDTVTARQTEPAGPVFEDGQAQVVPAFADSSQWIREELWVETEFDSDGDGRPDRVHVAVVRPLQTETEGLKVPVIYESSPHFAGTSGARQYLWNVRQEVGAEPPPREHQPPPTPRIRPGISDSQVDTWVPRGFAVVHSEAPGTGLSKGCPTVGGPPEALAPKAVIDWLNGRARGFTSPDGTEEVTAPWSTGKVGMTGTSYNGTIPYAAAAESAAVPPGSAAATPGSAATATHTAAVAESDATSGFAISNRSPVPCPWPRLVQGKVETDSWVWPRLVREGIDAGSSPWPGLLREAAEEYGPHDLEAFEGETEVAPLDPENELFLLGERCAEAYMQAEALHFRAMELLAEFHHREGWQGTDFGSTAE